MDPRRLRTIILIVSVLLGAFILVKVPVQAQESPDPEKLRQGAQLFAENCAVCHGAQGEGRIGANLSKDWPSIRPDLRIKSTIESGIPGSVMPAWGQAKGGPLTEDQIDALVVYILSWQSGPFFQITPLPTSTRRPPITPIPAVSGDPNLGAVLFDQNCKVCHGANGEGRVGANLAKPWSSLRADLEIKTTIQNGIVGSVMPAWSQEKGGPLSEQEIDNLVAFVLTLQKPGQQAQPTPVPVLPTGTGSLVGILLTLVLFAGIVALIWTLQRRRS